MFLPRFLDIPCQRDKIGVDRLQIYRLLRLLRADVARDVQVVAVFLDLFHRNTAGVAILFLPVLVRVDDLVDMIRRQDILALALLEVLGGVDEEHVIRFLALLQHENADRNARREEEVGGQTDNRVDIAVLEQLRADALLRAAPEKNAVRQDDSHDAFRFQIMEAVQQKGEVRGGFGRKTVVLETHVFTNRFGRLPSVTERRIGHHGIELRHPGRVHLAQPVPVVREGVAVVDMELRIFHPVKQHVHARQVVRGDVFLLPVNLADAVRPHAVAHVEQQGAGTAGEIEDALKAFPSTGGRFLAVQRDDAGEDAGYLLRRIELSRLLSRTGGELADQVLIGVAQSVAVGGELRQPLGKRPDDVAELGVARFVAVAQLLRIQIDLREQSGEGAGEGFVLDVFESLFQSAKQLTVLGARHLGDVAPEVFRLDYIVRLAAHLLFELDGIVRVLAAPHGQRGAAITRLQRRIILPQFPLHRRLVIVRQVAQEEEGEHIVAEVVRVHRAAQLIGDSPEDSSELSFVLFGHAPASLRPLILFSSAFNSASSCASAAWASRDFRRCS